MVRQPKIVVRRQHQHRAGFLRHRHLRIHRAGDVAEGLERARRAHGREIGAEAFIQAQAHSSLQSRMTLPELPERITSNPCWKSWYEKRWVMTLPMSMPLRIIWVSLYQVSPNMRP